MPIKDCKTIELPRFLDARGNLSLPNRIIIFLLKSREHIGFMMYREEKDVEATLSKTRKNL